MNYTDNNYIYSDLTSKIIGSAYNIFRELGAGFLEKVYENALVLELKEQGLEIKQQHPLKVYYKGQVIGEYYADLVVEDKVLVELKAVNELVSAHEVQLVNYLKATSMKVGLLINFGNKLKVMRKVF
ncbi:MAG TPA: GxxExxY protein [Gelria sp.]|jgi:GxxExxY protein|nr:GxxExxY protein [Gelria sp.]